MASEEITARFGADTTGFERGRQAMLNGLGQMGRDGELHFNRVAKAGKEFKNLIHEASSEMGGLGVVFKAVFSPMAGILAGATAGFAAVNSYISDINKNSDRLEKGTADPVFKMADALQEAKKRLAEFDEQYQHWAKTHGQTSPAEKLTKNLHDQLSLLDRQVAAAEKLSQKDKERLEHQKLLVTHGLQGRALQRLAGQIRTDDAAVQAAKAAQDAVGGRTDLESAQSAIAADEVSIQQLKESREAEKKKAGGMGWRRFGLGLISWGGGYAAQQKIQGEVDRNLTDINQQIVGLENRQRRNRAIITREQTARRGAANNLSEAQARLTGTESAFNSMSEGIEQTRQAIVTSGGFPTGAPPNSTADWLAASNARLHDWNVAHKIPDMMAGAMSTKALQDPTSKNIEDLNTMFRNIIDANGLKVNMTVEDQ